MQEKGQLHDLNKQDKRTLFFLENYVDKYLRISIRRHRFDFLAVLFFPRIQTRTKTLEFKVTFRCNRYDKKRVVDIPEISKIKRRREFIKLEDPCPCRVTVRK